MEASSHDVLLVGGGGAGLRAAIAADETVVVDVATDIEARAPEPWLPAGAA